MQFSIDSIANEYPFQPKKWQSAEGALSYLDEGEGTPIVFLHGNPTWSFFYRKLVLALRGEYRCIAIRSSRLWFVG